MLSSEKVKFIVVKYTVMRKVSALLVSATILLGFGLFVSSCDDDQPPVKPKLSFATATLSAKESDANLLIEVVIDKPASEDITIEYSLAGTALDEVTAAGTAPADYEVISDYGEVEIKKGETKGIIELDLFSDADLEDDENIEISIEDVDSEEIEITRDDEINITVKQEDGLFVALQWGIGAGESYPDVDMDLFLWAENTSSVLGLTNYRGISGSNFSTWIGGDNPEFFFMPTAVFEDGSFGLSCTYYAGTITPMNFVVTFIEVVNGVDATTATRNGTYTLANINKWDEEDAPEPLLVVKFKKAGTDYTDFEEITVPVASSRMGSPSIDLKNLPSKQIPTFEMSEKMNSVLNRFKSK
jgi:hypothetical protein